MTATANAEEKAEAMGKGKGEGKGEGKGGRRKASPATSRLISTATVPDQSM
jgi:hypothetical protein